HHLWRQNPRAPPGQLTFLNRRLITDLKPSLLHLGPATAKVARIERDIQTTQRSLLRSGPELIDAPPVVSRKLARRFLGKTKSERRLRGSVLHDPRRIIANLNKVVIAASGINIL